MRWDAHGTNEPHKLYCIHDNGEIWLPRCQPLPLHTLGHKRGYKPHLATKCGGRTGSCPPCLNQICSALQHSTQMFCQTVGGIQFPCNFSNFD